jgi:hypothetical protein
MSNNKLKLPTSITKSGASDTAPPVSDGVRTEILKTQRVGIRASAKVEVARLQVAKEIIAATKAFFDVLKSHNELQATRAEWEGRVTEAEAAVQKAQVDLKTAQEHNKPRMEELEQSGNALSRLLLLFDEVMKEVKDANLSEEMRKEAKQYLLELSERIVQLKK